MGKFCGKIRLEIVERNTGYPTVLNALLDNGSPYPTFTMDTGRTYLTVTLPVHLYFLPKVADNDKNALYQTKILEALGDKAMSKNELAQAMGYKGISAKTIAGSRNNASKRHIEASAPFDSFDGVRRTLSKVSTKLPIFYRWFRRMKTSVSTKLHITTKKSPRAELFSARGEMIGHLSISKSIYLTSIV